MNHPSIECHDYAFTGMCEHVDPLYGIQKRELTSEERKQEIVKLVDIVKSNNEFLAKEVPMEKWEERFDETLFITTKPLNEFMAKGKELVGLKYFIRELVASTRKEALRQGSNLSLGVLEQRKPEIIKKFTEEGYELGRKHSSELVRQFFKEHEGSTGNEMNVEKLLELLKKGV